MAATGEDPSLVAAAAVLCLITPGQSLYMCRVLAVQLRLVTCEMERSHNVRKMRASWRERREGRGEDLHGAKRRPHCSPLLYLIYFRACRSQHNRRMEQKESEKWKGIMALAHMYSCNKVCRDYALENLMFNTDGPAFL